MSDTILGAAVTFRPAADADWPALAAVTNAARRADGADEAYTAATFEAEYPQVVLARDGLVAEAGGEVVGYCFALVRERGGIVVGDLLGAVHPTHRRRGIGRALLHRASESAADRMAADHRPIPRELRSYALDSETGLIAMLEEEGYVPIRFGFEMRAFLTGSLPDRPLPPGLEVRPVEERHYRAIFEADDEAFRDHWGHRPSTEDDFRPMFYGPDVRPELWQVAWDGDQVAGMVINTIHPFDNAEFGIQRGWLDSVCVRRPWRGRGLAKALCAASLRVHRDEGMTEAWLGVDGLNPSGAVHLYEGLGFRVAKGWRAFGRPVEGPAPTGWQTAGDRATMEG